MKYAIIVAAFLAILVAAVIGRYTVEPVGSSVYVRLDRWTGQITWCFNTRCANAYGGS